MRPRACVAAACTLAAVRAYQTIDANSGLLQWQGRTYQNVDGGVPDGSRSFGWPGVRFSFAVQGATYVTMTLPSNESVTRMSVTVDGYSVATLFIEDEFTGPTYTLAATLDPSTAHSFVVYNMIESAFQSSGNFFQKLTLQSVSTDGTFAPPPPPLKRRLEFAGDSLTVGFGANGLKPCPGNILTEDNSVTWGNLLCTHFAANCSIIAWSGIGVYQNSPTCSTCKGLTLPQHFNRTLPNSDATPWDFSSFVPDALVINLGTNDFGHGQDNGTAWEAAFVDTYSSWVLDTVANKYRAPKTPVFVAIGPGQRAPNVLDCLNRVVAAVNSGGGNAVFLDVQVSGSEGCDNHPGHQGHVNMFNAAAPKIASVLGW